MFDLFDPSKMFLVGVVALIVIGPKDLPRVMRTVGQVVGRMRRMAAEFQSQFNEAMREAELEDVKKELAEVESAAKVDVSFDPSTLTQHDNVKAIEAPPGEGEAAAPNGAAATPAATPEPESQAAPTTPMGEAPALQSALAESVAREERAP